MKVSIKSIQDSIQKIKSEYPYAMKDILDDEEKRKKKRAELEEILRQYKELIEAYKAKIEEMMR